MGRIAAASWGTYVLGPVLGAIIGINLYGLLFAGDEVVEDYADPVLARAPAAVAATAPLGLLKSQLLRRLLQKKRLLKSAPAAKYSYRV